MCRLIGSIAVKLRHPSSTWLTNTSSAYLLIAPCSYNIHHFRPKTFRQALADALLYQLGLVGTSPLDAFAAPGWGTCGSRTQLFECYCRGDEPIFPHEVLFCVFAIIFSCFLKSFHLYFDLILSINQPYFTAISTFSKKSLIRKYILLPLKSSISQMEPCIETDYSSCTKTFIISVSLLNINYELIMLPKWK